MNEKKYCAVLKDWEDDEETRRGDLEVIWYRKESGEMSIDKAFFIPDNGETEEWDDCGVAALVDWDELERLSIPENEIPA